MFLPYFSLLALKSKNTAIYASDIADFIEYLDYCSKTKLHIVSMQGFDKVTDINDYYNRYSEKYFRQIYARLRNFEKEYLNHLEKGIYVYFLTLTIPQKDIDVFKGLENLRDSKRTFFHTLRNIRRDCLNKSKCHYLEYIWFIEPHKSGFPHLHLILFTDIADFIEGFSFKLKSHWSLASGASLKYGLDIRYICQVVPVEHKSLDDSFNFDSSYDLEFYNATLSDNIDTSLNPSHSSYYTSSIQFLVSYLIKYMSKSIFSSIDLSTLIMHSQVWKFYKPCPRWRDVRRLDDGSYRLSSRGSGAYRLWGYSVGLSDYLRVKKGTSLPEDDGYNVLSVAVGKNTVYQSDNVDLLLSLLRRHVDAGLFEES